MSESNAYKRFKANFIATHDRCSRVENLVEDGMPDVNCCINGIDIWLEFKTPKEPKRASTPLFGSNHKVSQSQKNWHLAQLMAGGKSFIYIETDRHVLVANGKYADEINNMTLGEIAMIAVCSFRRPLNRQAWRDLKNALYTAAI